MLEDSPLPKVRTRFRDTTTNKICLLAEATMMRVPQITIDMMVAVIALAHKRTCEKAAKEIGTIESSAVHKRVQAASRLCGAPLFLNTDEGMTLTAAGKSFYSAAVGAVEHAVLAEERVRAQLNLEAGHLRIGHSTYLPPTLLASILKLRLEGSPAIQIEHLSGTTDVIAKRVENGELHAGFGYLPVNRLALLTHVLWEEYLEVFIPASHRLADLSRIGATDLRGEPLIAVARAAMPWLYKEIDEYFGGFGVNLHVVADALGPPEALTMTEQKVGICLLGASEASRSGVVSRPLTARILTRKSGIFVREDNRHPTVKALVDGALELFPDRFSKS
jgi:DNA-binding transcriptional LysR family regulator